MNDRPTDDPIDALRGPALAAECARQADDITAMVLAYDAAPADAATRGVRRRGALVAAAAVASLGLGGLAVAGPGAFAPAADTPPPPAPVVEPAGDVEADAESGVVRHTTDPDVTCADGTHGKTVSSIAQSGGDVTGAAESQCGKPIQSSTETAAQDDVAAEAETDAATGVERHSTDPEVTCAEGNHGQTVSSIAQSGGDVTAAAHSQCGQPVQSGGDTGDTDDTASDAGDTDDTGDTDDAGDTDRPGPNEHANERAQERAGQRGADD